MSQFVSLEKVKQISTIEALQIHCEILHGQWDKNGFVPIHSISNHHQRTSIQCLNILRKAGFKFDIVTNDGKVFNNGDINDFKVKIEYNVQEGLTPPDNGIKAWRPVHKYETYLDKAVSDITWDQKFENFKGTVYAQGPIMHYANDKYKREIKPGVFVDVYDVIDCFEVTSGALQHAIKKLLAAGKRGHKDYEQDLIDILSSVERALFQYQEKTK